MHEKIVFALDISWWLLQKI